MTPTSPAARSRFHLAVPVDDLDAARAFYGGVLALPQGRRSDTWIDWDFDGHQLVTHLVASAGAPVAGRNPVDGDDVPVPHFGVITSVETFSAMADRLHRAGVAFLIEPHVRFEGEAGEQRTMFFSDPAGNALEIKAFADDAQVFAT